MAPVSTNLRKGNDLLGSPRPSSSHCVSEPVLYVVRRLGDPSQALLTMPSTTAGGHRRDYQHLPTEMNPAGLRVWIVSRASPKGCDPEKRRCLPRQFGEASSR